MHRFTLIACTMLLLALALCACGKSGSSSAPPPPAATGWQRHAANPLLTPTLTASTIQWSIADPSVLHDPVDGKWKMWWSSGFEDRSTHVSKVVIMYAESGDGVSWTAQAAPALDTHVTASDWDYTHVETPTVIINERVGAPASQRFVLCYSGANIDAQAGQGRPTTFPYYQIGLAYSADGTSFTRWSPGVSGKPGLVIVPNAAFFGNPAGYGDGLLADPEVAARGGVLHLWCSSYAETSARAPLAFGISHLVSSDFGQTWSATSANPLPSLFRPGDVSGGQQPSVLYDAALGRFEMWFTNDTAAEKATVPATSFTAVGFWHATSSDGVTWTPDYSVRDIVREPAHDYESLGLLTGIEVVRDGGVDRAFFSAWGTHGNPDSVDLHHADPGWRHHAGGDHARARDGAVAVGGSSSAPLVARAGLLQRTLVSGLAQRNQSADLVSGVTPFLRMTLPYFAVSPVISTAKALRARS